MSNTVGELLGFPKIEGDVGIEVEVESFNAFKNYALDGWEMKMEGSLRNHGAEFVTMGPIPLKEVKPQLDVLFEAFKLEKQKLILPNLRTSTHMHINVTDLTLTQYYNMMTYYWLVEGVIMPYCGPDRQDNLHCYQLSNAEALVDFVKNELKHPDSLFAWFDTDKIRYAGQNINCTKKFGSIEYRGMRGTTEVDVLNNWATSLVNMRDNTKDLFKTPAHVVDMFYRSNYIDFLECVFGKDMTKVFIQHCGPVWQECLDNNAALVSEYAYIIEDWEAFESKFKKKRRKKLPKIGEPDLMINPMPDPVIIDEIAEAQPLNQDDINRFIRLAQEQIMNLANAQQQR